MKSLKVKVKQVGRKRPLIRKEVAIDSLDNNSKISLKELICEIVKLEVVEFQNKQEKNKKNSILTYLNPDGIEKKAEKGKIAIDDIKNETKVNMDEAIATAILAFEDGIYYVFVDDKKIEKIDDLVEITNDSELMFLRLAMLVGGIF